MHRPWTTKEESFLKENYDNCLAKQIAFELKRTEKSIFKRAEQMGIKKRNRTNPIK